MDTNKVSNLFNHLILVVMLHSGIGFHCPQVHWHATSHLYWTWSAGLSLGITSRGEQTTQIEATSNILTFIDR